MKKIKLIIGLIIIAAVFSLVFVSLSYILRPDSDMKTRFAGFYAEPSDTIDVVVIGSSPVQPLYAAPLMWSEYGITMYPLSTNSQPTVGIKYLVKEAQKTQPDSLYVIDVSMFMLDPESLLVEPRIRHITDNMKYSMNRIEAINAMVTNPSERINYYFDISKYHPVLFSPDEISPDPFSYFDFSRPSQYKGYLFVDAVESFEPIDISNVTETAPIPAESEAVLEDLMSYCNDEQLKVLFVISPYIASADRKMNHNYIQSLIESNDFEFIDFNDAAGDIGIDYSTDFYNSNHMNILGAEKITSYFGDYLKQSYKITDKRTNPDYAAWNQSYAEWEIQAEITKQGIYENVQKLKN